MNRAFWIAGAFVAGLVVSGASTRTTAETMPVPSWVKPGVCYDTGNSGTEFVVAVEGTWVKTSKSGDGMEHWRNLAASSDLRRLSDDTCRRSRR